MANEERVLTGIDYTRPNIARVYDYLIGGKDHSAVDRAMGNDVLRLVPEACEYGLANREFLRRAVRYMVAEAGIRQFLDIGSGLPTRGNVHEIAQELDPGARVVYVDNDPVVIVHARALLENHDTTAVISADLRRPADILTILTDPALRQYIDLDQPVGLLMISILHHINDDEDPVGITTRLRTAVAPGSHLAVTHFHNPGSEHPEQARLAIASERQFNENFGTGRWRTRAEILALFGDFEMLDPGLVPMPDWRPEAGDRQMSSGALQRVLGGLARKN